MNALGFYLLVSLFFVAGTLIELGVILEIMWHFEKEVNYGIQPTNEMEGGQVFTQVNLANSGPTRFKADKIDRVVLLTFVSLYCLFNLVYWIYFLS